MSTDDWYGPDAATFGDRLSAARDNAGMSRADLARRIGVRDATLKNWEEDRAEPRANRVSTIAGCLGVSVMWLLNGEGAGVPAPGEESAPVLPDGAREELRAIRRLLREADERAERLERTLANV